VPALFCIPITPEVEGGEGMTELNMDIDGLGLESCWLEGELRTELSLKLRADMSAGLAVVEAEFNAELRAEISAGLDAQSDRMSFLNPALNKLTSSIKKDDWKASAGKADT
jgi:hypothetical protein